VHAPVSLRGPSLPPLIFKFERSLWVCPAAAAAAAPASEVQFTAAELGLAYLALPLTMPPRAQAVQPIA
jgi:hypothetical protein